ESGESFWNCQRRVCHVVIRFDLDQNVNDHGLIARQPSGFSSAQRSSTFPQHAPHATRTSQQGALGASTQIEAKSNFIHSQEGWNFNQGRLAKNASLSSSNALAY